jgi:hypothetical protein
MVVDSVYDAAKRIWVQICKLCLKFFTFGFAAVICVVLTSFPKIFF